MECLIDKWLGYNENEPDTHICVMDEIEQHLRYFFIWNGIYSEEWLHQDLAPYFILSLKRKIAIDLFCRFKSPYIIKRRIQLNP